MVLIFASSGFGQVNKEPNSQPALPAVTAFATAERVRFTAPSSVVQMHLEIYTETGAKLFDFELKGGNVLDWHLQNAQAQRLDPGSYLCVVTVKNLAGQISQKIGTINISGERATIEPLQASKLSSQQAQAVGPLEENTSLVVIGNEDRNTPTVIAHTGEDGQIVRGRGPLSFRIGDFFKGNDTEQMRLTPEGNLGIGITHPQVKLDVDGFIRGSQGIVFPDGSVQFSAARRTYGAASLAPGQSLQNLVQGQEHSALEPNTSGTGTTGKIPKWLDGAAGVLNDSNITENNGAIGINGSPDTRFRLDVNGSTRIRGSNPGFNLEGLRAAGNIWLFQTVDDDGRFRLFGQDNINPGVERFNISVTTGNVGLGSPNPDRNLTVQRSGGAYINARDTSGAGPFEVLLGADAAGGILSTMTNHDLQLRAGSNSTKMIIKADGRVGVGTTSPGARLAVQGDGIDVLLGSAGCGAPTAAIGFGSMSGCTDFALGANANTGAAAGIFLNRPAGRGLHFRENNGVDQMTIAPGGNVGIGLDPLPLGARFQVQGTVGGGRFKGTDPLGTGVYAEATGDFGSAVYATASGSGAVGVSASSGSGPGVSGLSNSNTGVVGTSTTGVGVYGVSTNGNDGIVGESRVANRSGVYGFTTHFNGCGGCFENRAGGLALGVTGIARVSVLEITGGSDLAEHFEVSERAKPGMVVAIDPQNAGKLTIARGAYNRRAAGVISGAKNLSTGLVLPDAAGAKKSAPVALSGRVWVYCDAAGHSIQPGDLLTTSNTPGHAMKVTNYPRAQGAIIGKAMTGLKSGRGLVLVLVSLE